MNSHSVIRILIRAYPLEWRAEYGDELELMLARMPLTIGVMGNVLVHAGLQRIRYAPVWEIAGFLLALKLIVGTIVNSIWPLTPGAYRLFFISDEAIAFFVGSLAVVRDRKSIRAAMGSAALAATVGMIPEVMLGLLWAVHLVHPTILGLDGSPYLLGRGVTDLCLRGQFDSPSPMIFLGVPSCAIPAAFMGLLGGSIVKMAGIFDRRMRKEG